MNAKITSIRSPQIVNSNCILYDYCAGLVLTSAPGTSLKVLGPIRDYLPDILLSVHEVARRCSLAEKTIYNWIETGKLRHEHGLRMIGKKTRRIDWMVFKACIDQDAFAGEDAPCT